MCSSPPRDLDSKACVTIGDKVTSCLFDSLPLPRFYTRLVAGQNFEVKADDLERIGELGRGAYGVVDKMRHVPSGIIMAVKVGRSCKRLTAWTFKIKLASFLPKLPMMMLFVWVFFLLSADPRHRQHSRAEEAAHGLGHLHEDRGLLLHRHLLRGALQRGASDSANAHFLPGGEMTSS